MLKEKKLNCIKFFFKIENFIIIFISFDFLIKKIFFSLRTLSEQVY
jgi:hypothetical protein